MAFPPVVASDILALGIAHSKMHRSAVSVSPRPNPWAGINPTRKLSVELQGHSFTPKGVNRAAEVGDRVAVASFLCSGMDFDTPDAQGWTPMMVATFNDEDDVANFLINRGANNQVTDAAGYGALHWPSFKAFGNVARQLFEKQA
ncbi:MAG: ankyrin repeat domain-containing protein [Gallionella sp.]